MKGLALVVDDEPALREIITYLLKQRGWRVRKAPNGEAALADFQQHPAQLVLVDCNMPGIDGFEVAKRLKTFPKPPVVVMLTARPQRPPKRDEFEALGLRDYFNKPFDEVEFFEALDRWEAEMAPQVGEA